MSCSTRLSNPTKPVHKIPRVRINLQTALFFAFIAVFDRSALIIVPILAAFLHEIGHLAVMLALGVQVKTVEITLFGAEIRSLPSETNAKKQLSPLGKAAIYSAGAAMNLLTGYIGAKMGFEFFGACSAALAAVNMLPIRTLDGGCVIDSLFWRAPEILLDILSGVSIFALWLAAVYFILLCGGNLSLMLFADYMFVSLFVYGNKGKGPVI